MSRSRSFPMQENDLNQLEDVTQSLECLEHLLVTQDQACYGDLNPQHLAALLDILINSLGQVTGNCRHELIRRQSRQLASKPQHKTGRA